MKVKKYKIKTNIMEIIYLIAVALYCFMALSGGSTLIVLNNSEKIVIYGIIIVLLGVKIILQRLSIKEILIYTVLCLICLLAYIKLDTIFFLMNFLVIISIKNVDIKKIVKTDIAIKCIFLLTHLMIYGIDYFCNYEKVKELIMNDGRRIRHAFYFTHPNIVSTIIYWLILDFYYIKEKLKVQDIIIGTILMITTYIITKSRTTLLLYILWLIIIYIEKFFKNKNIYYKIIDMTNKYIIEIMAIFSIMIGILYKYNDIFVRKILNPITSGRVYASYAALEKFGVKIFFNVKAIDLEKYLIIDNFYVRCAVFYGLIFVIVLAIMTKFIKTGNKKIIKDKIMIIILAISLFSEYSGIIIGNAIPLLLLGRLIVDKEKNKDKENEEK